MSVITLNRETQRCTENHFQSHIKVVRWNAFLPTWSLKIFEITTGTLCSAPPWKAGETDEDVHFWVWVVKFAAKTAFSNSHLCHPKPFISTVVSKLICLLWCLSPDRRSLVFAVQQFCALESGSFLLAKGYCEHWKVCWSYAAWITKSEPGGLGCTYIYLGFTSTRANHIQLLYG